MNNLAVDAENISDLILDINGQLNELIKREVGADDGREYPGTDDWTIHDIRRTVATGLAKLKVEPYIVERILNHSSGTFGGVTGVYNRFGYMDEMREALEKWSDHLEELI